MSDLRPIMQIVITKSPEGFNVIIMDDAHVMYRGHYLSREFALSAVADFMAELVPPPKATQ